MQPGDTIRPGSSDGGDPSRNNEGMTNVPVNPQPAVAQENASWYHPETSQIERPPQPVPVPVPAPAPPAPVPEDSSVQTGHDPRTDVTWTASEFVAHEKPFLWYLAFIFFGLLVAAITFWVTREIITVVAVVGALGAFGAMATRHPRVLDYALDDHGVYIGSKLYPYVSFRSFSLFNDGALHAVDLIPMERFKPPVTVYFPPDQEQQVLSKLGENLAYEERTPDFVDRLMHRLRF